MDVIGCVEIYSKLALGLSTTGLSTQQQVYRNHIIRIDQQSNELVNTMYSILHPELSRAQHPEWQRYNIVMPTTGPVPLTGQPLLRPEALSHGSALRNLAVRYANIVLNTQNLDLQKALPLFQQIVGTFETIRTSYMSAAANKIPGLYLPMRQIRDSLAWMNNFHQTAIQQAGQTGTVTL